jgi:hypothetical protein
MKATDYIELWVEDDGDTILCLRQEPQSEGPGNAIEFPSRNLCYGSSELEELKAELVSYGCWDNATIDRAIKEAAEGPYNEETFVK